MTATLTFTLPEDLADYEAAVNGQKYKSALWDIDCWLRNAIKYHEKDYQPVRDMIHQILDENNVKIDDI